MKFINDDFMIHNKYGKILYNKYAKDMPIFDYHCHLDAKEIWEDRKFTNITEAWLEGDHYKWRAMRACGVEERKITGDIGDYDKFLQWSKIVPQLIGNPLYHWTHLELKKFFDIDICLNEESAEKIWEETKSKLHKTSIGARKLIEMSNVFAVCTTNDPIEDLTYHKKLKRDNTFRTRVIPAMRPDKALNIEMEDYSEYIIELEKASNLKIKKFYDLMKALTLRVEFFNDNGCRASDHAFNYIPYRRASYEELDLILLKALEGREITIEEEEKYKTELMIFLAKEYCKRDWAMEIHIGALRDVNKNMVDRLGVEKGYDSINDYRYGKELGELLNAIEITNELPRTILFTLNPKDNYLLSTMAGCFQGEEEGISKVQFGTAWWFLDHKIGMEEQMKILASTGVLSKFIGMLTDSRSFLSYPRHDYFRRILCNLIGEYIELGEYPWDEAYLGKMIKDICFNNARNYIRID